MKVTSNVKELVEAAKVLFEAEEVIYLPEVGYIRVPPGFMTEKEADSDDN